MAKRPLVTVLAFLSIGLSSIWACQKTKPFEVVRPVYTMEIFKPDLLSTLTFNGRTKAFQEVPIYFNISGEILKKYIEPGKKVKKGDVLAQLDPREWQLEYKQQNSNLTQAKTLFTETSNEYEKTRRLYEVGKITDSQLDNALAELQSAKAQLSAARDALSSSREKLNFTTLRAPVDGTIASINFELNQNVISGQTIATIESGGSIQFEIEVPAQMIPLINMGQAGLIKLNSPKNNEVLSKVTFIGTMNQEGPTYPVKLTFLKSEKTLYPEMTGKVTFNLEKRSGTEKIIIPTTAVLGLPGGQNQVWLLDQNSKTVKSQVVQIGKLSSQGIEIVQGLKTGDILVIRGINNLIRGMKVKPLNSKSTT